MARVRCRLLAIACLCPLTACFGEALPAGPVAIDLTLTRPATARRTDQAVVRLRAAAGEAAVTFTATGATATWGGQAQTLAGGLPAAGASATWRLVRGGHRLSLCRGNQTLLVRRGPPAGAGTVVVQGSNVRVAIDQVAPLEPAFATDDFLRESDEAGAWRTVAGQWRIEAYRDPLVAKFGLAPQATWYAGTAGERPALALLGEPTWGDVALSADLRLGEGAAGLVANAPAADRYSLARLAAGKLELVEVRGGQSRLLAAAPYQGEPDAWLRLTLQASGDCLRAGVNGQWLVSAVAPGVAGGRAGLWTAGRAAFDNVQVTSAELTWDDFADPRQLGAGWTATGGWAIRDRQVAGWPARGQEAVLTSRAAPFDSGEIGTRLAVTADGAAGAQLQVASGATWRLAIQRRGAQESWALTNGSPAPLATGPLNASPTGHHLLLRRRGAAVEAVVDGQRRAVWYDGGGETTAALFATVGAKFDEAAVCATDYPPVAELFRTDFSQRELPGKQQGEVWRVLGDVLRPRGHRWRLPDPQDDDGGQLIGQPEGREPLELWTAPVPGDAGLTVTLNELDPQATLSLLLSSRDGYALRLHGREAVLCRGDREVGRAALDEAPQSARIQRDGPWVVAEVADRRLVWQDPDPPESGPVGLRLERGQARLASLLVTAENAVSSPFQVIDTTWREAGRWNWNSGMACIAWSYWITGDAREAPALLWRREPLPRDLNVVCHVAEYTDGYDDPQADHTHQHFPLHDVSLVLDGDGRGADSGYRFVIGAEGGRSARLYRRGQMVAENPRFTITMGGHCNNPRTIKVEASRREGRLSLRLNGSQAIQWQDPEPLAGEGLLALGVTGCRANFSDFVALQPAAGDDS